MGILTVLWEKWIEFKRDIIKITVTMLIAPIMYIIIFGIGIDTYDSGSYLSYLIPGIVTMVTMTGSFGAITQNMCIQRLYEKALDQVMISPTPLWQFVIGQIVGGSLRGLYGAFLIIILTLPLRLSLQWNMLIILILFLNGCVFSTIGLTLSFFAKSYSDAPKYNTYIIVPMTFLCNTFFSVERFPRGVKQIIGVLPLSQACQMVRSLSSGISCGYIGIVILLGYLIIFGLISIVCIYKYKNI